MIEPNFVKVLARDVRPYHHAVWSTYQGEGPFVNPIVYVRWSEDGEHLYFGLDSCNTLKARPDEVLELIDVSDDPAWEYGRTMKAEWVLPPPPPPPPPPSPRDALALRALRAKHWKWCEGMQPRAAVGQPDYHHPRHRVGAEATARRGLLPDLEDPATVGALLTLVRKVYHDPDKLWDGWVEVHRDHRDLFFARQPYHNEQGGLEYRHLGTGSSEAEALVAALEAAPCVVGP